VLARGGASWPERCGKLVDAAVVGAGGDTCVGSNPLCEETVMAKRVVPLVIDVEPKEVPADAALSTLVPSTVPSVVTHDGKIIPREAFARWRAEDIPGGFDTQHATINKAGLTRLSLYT
jgi:hypothetical protein